MPLPFMPPNPPQDPRRGLSPEQFRAKVARSLEPNEAAELSFAARELQDPTLGRVSRRVRSHDEMVPAAEKGRRLRLCRQTITIGDTVFRCDAQAQHPPGTTHTEHGLVKKKGQPDVDYYIAWETVPSRVVRSD